MFFMKKYVKYALSLLLVFAIFAGIIGAVSFHNFLQTGVHSFCGYTRLDFQQQVYFVNADTKEVSGSSTLTVSGLVQPAQPDGASKAFHGSISLAQYPLSLEAAYGQFTASNTEGAISIACLDADRFAKANVTYWLYMSAEDPTLFAVYIYCEDGTTLTAYPGQTQQEAIANCESYWQWFRQNEHP